MTVVEKGRVQGRNILLDQSVPIPDGTSVLVRIETPDTTPASAPDSAEEAAAWADITGMWADREDMADSAKWVRTQREKWRQRLDRKA